MKEYTKSNLEDLFDRQISDWPQANHNYTELANVLSRPVPVGKMDFKIQFNPARIVSSAAKVDAKSIKERKCFLCEENRPAVQDGLAFNSALGNVYTVLVNPFPIFNRHLTIPAITHLDQLISGRIGDMLQLAEVLEDYIVFYNGPRCGASAPDHFHFQAGNKGFLPLERQLKDLLEEKISEESGTALYRLSQPLASAFLIRSASIDDASAFFERLCSLLPVKDGETEPMMNLLCWKEDGVFNLVVVAREKHRPSCYFAEGEDNILISPASVDFGGVFITPLRKDYDKIEPIHLSLIIDEVLLSEAHLQQLMEAVRVEFTRKQPDVTVGILSGDSVSAVFNGPYLFEGAEVAAEHRFEYRDGKIFWNGRPYGRLEFHPVNYEECSFELKEVTIGIDFHWERKENQKFQGSLIVIVEDGRLTAIDSVGVEDYLTSVISSEMSADAPEEFLKSHAVISRSWLLAQMEKRAELGRSGQTYSSCIETGGERIRWYDREDHTLFDVCADDHCQRYQGMTRATNPTVRKVIDQTWGEVLKYGGKICDARFSKCCGGVTEVFPTCWEETEHPYLVPLRDNVEGTRSYPDLRTEDNARRWILSQPDAYCNTHDAALLSKVLNNYDQETRDFYRWKVEYTVEELSALVKERSGIDFGEIQDLVPMERGSSGRLSRLKIVGSRKTMVIGKELEIRKTLSATHLFSSAFVVRKEDGKFILDGAGWGHGVGLCQIGAAVMGARGFRYEQILLHYFVGAEIVRNY